MFLLILMTTGLCVGGYFKNHFIRNYLPENVTRVNNNKFMFENTVATQAYIDNVSRSLKNYVELTLI